MRRGEARRNATSWQADATKAEWATRAVEAEARIAELEAALRSVATQCDNVIFNCRQRPADNERHIASWISVRDFAIGAAK